MPRIKLSEIDPDSGLSGPRRFRREEKRSRHAILDETASHVGLENLDAAVGFTPSLGVSRHEREWIFSYLSQFYELMYITDVVRRVKGGKEANVYVCTAHPSLKRDLIAAKLYRPRMFRNLRNTSRYHTGRVVLDQDGKEVWDGHMLHAIQKGTNKGKEMAHTSWLGHEYRALEVLHLAGVPVPEPLTMSGNVILMEYIGDLDLPAPALSETHLARNAARPLFDILVAALDSMLDCNMIHGDMSAYNVLYWEGKPTIIDLPQVVDPRTNRDAWDIFRRDVERTCQYFEQYGIRVNAYHLAQSIWGKHIMKQSDLNMLADTGLDDPLNNIPDSG